ncbi:MAG: lipoyl synthase [Kiritimatiellae bacterium]|nr:lipoyl synthase [Kiritimatiellia bacterium]
MTRLPPWIRKRVRLDTRYAAVREVLNRARLHTVCQSAQCPNECECFGRGTATFMILGNVCTRNCRFCAVTHGEAGALDPDEPRRVAGAVMDLGVRHAVITSVTRDDVPDGGARIFAETVRAIRRASGGRVTVEVLTPDFKGAACDMATVLAAGPDVFNHNIETVQRLQASIRPQADYARSLAVLRVAADHRPKPFVKSGIMVGLGETDEELYAAMADLRRADCEILTIGQYLAPSRGHWPVARFVEPHVFEAYAERGRKLGFKSVVAGPLVRSSYEAEKCLAQCRDASASDAEADAAGGAAAAE